MLARPRPSHGLVIASLILTAIMVHPSLASLLAMAANAVLLAALRTIAWREGRRDAREVLRAASRT